MDVNRLKFFNFRIVLIWWLTNGMITNDLLYWYFPGKLPNEKTIHYCGRIDQKTNSSLKIFTKGHKTLDTITIINVRPLICLKKRESIRAATCKCTNTFRLITPQVQNWVTHTKGQATTTTIHIIAHNKRLWSPPVPEALSKWSSVVQLTVVWNLLDKYVKQ